MRGYCEAKKKNDKPTSTLTEPAVFSISPRIAERREDLPDPTIPITAINEPVGIFSWMLAKKKEIILLKSICRNEKKKKK